MALNVRWTKRASRNLDQTVRYIAENWSVKSGIKFVKRVHRFVNILIEQPKIGKIEFGDVRSFVISKQTIIFYRILHSEIIILRVVDSRQSKNNLQF